MTAAPMPINSHAALRASAGMDEKGGLLAGLGNRSPGENMRRLSVGALRSPFVTLFRTRS